MGPRHPSRGKVAGYLPQTAALKAPVPNKYVMSVFRYVGANGTMRSPPALPDAQPGLRAWHISVVTKESVELRQVSRSA